MALWIVKWEGSPYAHCNGQWRMWKNIVSDETEMSDSIPFNNKQIDDGEVWYMAGPANTHGTYSRWYFNEDYLEEWEDYEDGLKYEEWINEPEIFRWLTVLDCTRTDWHQIYETFQSQDFRTGCCGGCI